MKTLILFTVFIGASFSLSCAHKSTATNSGEANKIPFDVVGSHIVVIPTIVNDHIASKFIFDTGIGPSMISKKLCAELKCQITGKIVGKRMSGQAMELPTARISSLVVGAFRQENVEVAIWDTGEFPKELSEVQGFISPLFFQSIPFTMDYVKKEITLETAETLRQLVSTGASAPMQVVKDGPSVQLFLKMQIPGDMKIDKQITVEVDTGSNSLILDERFMKPLGMKASDKSVKRNEGSDETGHKYVRYVDRIKGPISVPGHLEFSQSDLTVMFQKIIYDGLIGTAFLRQFVVTYDLSQSVMIFNTAR
jgi:hypothetical protein